MFLEKINAPQDLKKIPLDELPGLAAEIRQKIIEVVSGSGGHLASSLGAVELAIALHYCLNAPEDKIIWDVGHQAYAHKILTGRAKNFASLRKYQGLTGFPCKEESPYDPFTTGHSSTAVSLALGLACARDIPAGGKYYRAVAVIGDGSLSGGLCFEGLNNAGHLKKDLLVVLNTNEMSIAPNVGAISNYLNKLISLPVYNRFKDSLDKFVASRIPKGSRLVKIANKFEKGLKELFIPGVLFEELGFRYFGPFDGHNLQALIPTLKKMLTIKGPLLMHVVTKKGKGYPPAENNPVKFHSAPAFEVHTGETIARSIAGASYTAVFSAKLAALAKEDKKIVAVTAAMAEGTGLDKFRDGYPERFFDVGIAEAHAVCFAAGLAREGMKPVVAIYSTFLQRAYDQIIECVALQKLGVVFCLDRAGVVGEDGATHQGVFDLSFLRSVPNLVVAAPAGAQELGAMLELALSADYAVALRYPKETAPTLNFGPGRIELGKAQVLREGADFALVALGSMVAVSLEAMAILEKQGLKGTLVNARFVKPLDRILLRSLSSRIKHIFSVEDGVLDGGFGSAVAEAIDKPVTRIGLPDEFMPCGSRCAILAKYGLTAEGIADTIKRQRQ